jgi:hypothetical protein
MGSIDEVKEASGKLEEVPDKSQTSPEQSRKQVTG